MHSSKLLSAIAITLVGCTVLSLAAAAQAAPIRERQIRQDSRIVQGIHSGALTRPEAARLLAQDRRLDRTIAVMRATGGRLSPAERVIIHLRQDQLSHRIGVQKHDRQDR